jgi:hypothetical protein
LHTINFGYFQSIKMPHTSILALASTYFSIDFIFPFPFTFNLSFPFPKLQP